MSILNKMLASVGIGAAKVDTLLEKEQYMPGEMIAGKVMIYGGKVAQPIEGISLFLMCNYIREVDDHKHHVKAVLAEFEVAGSHTIASEETKEIAFSFRLPYNLPYSIGQTQIWLQTGATIKNALDPQDKDYLAIHPDRPIQNVMEAIEGLQFSLRKATCQERKHPRRYPLPFQQEFEYIPTGGMYLNRLDELEVIFQYNGQSLDLMLQIDRKGFGFSGMIADSLDLDETYVSIHFTAEELHNSSLVATKIANVLQQHV
ncbi:SpoOM family protein [Fictibacillus macauensis ZFHKF-1]|uniref:SpoOM family protein n=1 Tax=Fictibacillus macauensis ZFHKF-1 TaxID=1196324 RepID=I8ADQ8_9BACL|nr:sporulation protein [Fictibacillus macauensis]EIT83697.1 SpoOM family protein [Fictibacillus macauensis ZFHKF-1]